jgi:hypothetical protein
LNDQVAHLKSKLELIMDEVDLFKSLKKKEDIEIKSIKE